MTVHYIINRVAGQGCVDHEPVIREMMAASGTRFEIDYTTRGGDGSGLARAAAKAGAELVVAVGGDGTANDVASGLVGTETVLGVLPCGSGNALARGLGIPTNFVRACRMLLSFEKKRIDVGRIGDNIFLSTAGVGIDAEVIRRYSASVTGQRGFLPYAMAAYRALLEYEPQSAEIVIEGRDEPICGRFGLLTIANTSQFGYGVTVAPKASPVDGEMDLCLLPHLGLLSFLRHGYRLLTGTIDQMPHVQMHRCGSLLIRRQAAGPLQVDGEARMAGELVTVETLPHALSVAVPR